MHLKNFFKNNSGSFTTIVAITVPILLGVFGLTLDYVSFYDQRARLQQAADAAALASVRELSLAGTNNSKSNVLEEIAKNYVLASYYGDTQKAKGTSELTVGATPDTKKSEITIDLSYRWAPMFAQLFDTAVTPIKITATARLAGDTLTCVVGLMQPQTLAKSSIHMDNKSTLQADGCAVYSNSVSRYGLRADNNARMSAQSICTAGGVITFGKAKFSPKPITDCPKIEDPLAGRAAPIYTSCTENNLIITNDAILKPGVYCGGLTIAGNAKVTFDDGLFTIKDGPFIVQDTASITGKSTSFFLTGDGSIFDFGPDTSISLAAMETGPTAGLLFYEDRNVNYSFEFNPFKLNKLPADVRLHKISSNNARNLLGTIYLSRSILLIDAEAAVADASAYTAIIVGRLWLQKGPKLMLNSDYTKTTVPVPGGLIGTKPVLVN